MNTFKIPTHSTIEQIAKGLLTEMPALKKKLEELPKLHDSNILMAEVLKFLYLIASHNKSLSPSMRVDLAWHEFILCTRLYTQFCNTHFGKYIHHTPGGDEKENRAKFLKTIQLYIIHFGKPDKAIWGDTAHEEWMDSQCGTCNTD